MSILKMNYEEKMSGGQGTLAVVDTTAVDVKFAGFKVDKECVVAELFDFDSDTNNVGDYITTAATSLEAGTTVVAEFAFKRIKLSSGKVTLIRYNYV
jgi:uncharacterized OB-fold protein